MKKKLATPARSKRTPSSVLGTSQARARIDTPQGLHPSTEATTFPIVGIGASAGGLEAFTSLLRGIEAGSGVALVLIQHLDPSHTSFLREALANTTKMKVQQAQDGMRVEVDHVYVIPPNACLGIQGGKLTIVPRPDDPRVQHLPVDHFFRALAAERGSRAIGVVLSGTASDGTEGLRAIKEADGITFAQEPSSAKFRGMPQSARDARVVDYCMPIPALAEEILRLCHHPYVVAPDSTPAALDAPTLQKIFALVKKAARVDFSEYKSPTFERRLARRMALRRADTLAAYLTVLQESPEEITALYEDVLIHVTSFFRDPEVFESVKANVFPVLMKSKPEGAPIRVWVAGCATGEEVYSLGVALVEFLGESSRPVQIFGSDVNSKAIETARLGVYPEAALREVSDERRRKFFTRVERGYRINKAVRDLCVFVQHDLARDPPFSKLDLVSCRNALIYFDQPLQKRVVPTFHYALSEPGFLLLGRAESISGFKDLFEAFDKANKIFTRTAVPSTLRFAQRSEAVRTGPSPSTRARDEGEAPPQGDLQGRIDRLLLGRYAPPGVVVNERMEVLQYRGQTGAYLQAAPGAPQNNVMQMARGGLAMVIRSTVATAKKEKVATRASGIEVGEDGFKKTCDVVVIPLVSPAPIYVILFDEHPAAALGQRTRGARPQPAPGPMRGRRDAGRVFKLEQELAATREYLESLIAEHGRTNEDLGTANEELVSGNEELQSMNEELETAKEELQSINEELTTVNEELQSRNHEVTQVNSDLVNLLATVDIPILILDLEQRIRRFTPKARRILNVVTSDIGRPFEDIKPNIVIVDLARQIAEVIETAAVKEVEVQDGDGSWYRLQIRPYRTTENRIDGAILSLFDINAMKHHLTEVELASSDVARESHIKDDFMATLSHELRTPLSSMLMRAQLLSRGQMDEAQMKRAGEAIEAGVKRQVQLIDDLLDVSRIVAGKVTLDLAPVGVAHVITSAVESLSGSFERKALKLEVEIPPELSMAKVYGDDVRLQQVVLNLLANAIKFTPEGGKVTVSLTASEKNAVIWVQDTGMGIEPDFLPHVFNRFTQENSTSTRAFGGLGLGLAISRHLVELHHGTVQAESPGGGKGATFTVTLPLMKAVRASVPSSEPIAVNTTSLEKLRILVVEDDPATRDAIADMLARTGANVRLAASSAEAMKAIDEFLPELLLCDIAMPGEDGYAFIRRLRADPAGHAATIPALALTALAHDEDRERALAAGFQMHIAKPVDIDLLTKAMLELAATRGPNLRSHPSA